MTKNWKIIQALLKKRGLVTKKEQAEFFKPAKLEVIPLRNLKISQKEMVAAIKRIKQALKNQELIYIYGDYDTDGVSSTAILWETLNSLGFKVMPFIPGRNDPVRGLSPAGIDTIIKQASAKGRSASGGKPALIITVDNGISAFKGCQYAHKLGIDIIITDHHLPKNKNNKKHLPKAVAIIHTTQLAGAGVAWFFSREIIRHLRGVSHSRGVNFFHLGSELLDLAALGTIADMVPLLNSNRSLAKFGLDKIRLSQRPGLISLAKTANIDLKELDDHQVSYVLAPRLNALGRLEHALDSLRLVCTKDKNRAKNLAEHLNQINQLRQDKTSVMFLDAKNKVNKNKKLIFVASKHYHEGVVGLVAGRLVEEFHRPAVVVALGKNYSKASGRSLKGFNILKAIRNLEPYLLEHGGHELAAGFTAENKNLKIIQKKLEALAVKTLSTEDLKPLPDFDCELNFADITWELFKEVEKFRPFGFANPQPLFLTREVKLLDYRTVGQDSKHLKLSLRGDSLKVDAIAFGLGHLAQKLAPGQLIDIIYSLEKNEWNGKKSLQLKIKDITIDQ